MDTGLKKTLIGLVILISCCFLLPDCSCLKPCFTDILFSVFSLSDPVLLSGEFRVFLFFSISSLQKSHNQFIRSFMVSTGIKLMIYLILILVYVLSSPKSAIPFAITLSVLYIAYTAYDLLIMLSLLKQKKENSNLSNQLSN